MRSKLLNKTADDEFRQGVVQFLTDEYILEDDGREVKGNAVSFVRRELHREGWQGLGGTLADFENRLRHSGFVVEKGVNARGNKGLVVFEERPELQTVQEGPFSPQERHVAIVALKQTWDEIGRDVDPDGHEAVELVREFAMDYLEPNRFGMTSELWEKLRGMCGANNPKRGELEALLKEAFPA